MGRNQTTIQIQKIGRIIKKKVIAAKLRTPKSSWQRVRL
jgi:hypothetical protein